MTKQIKATLTRKAAEAKKLVSLFKSSAAITVITAIISVLITIGIYKERVDSMGVDISEIKINVSTIQEDIKKILQNQNQD